MEQHHEDQDVGAPEVDATNQPAEIHVVLDEEHARIRGRRIPASVWDVIDGKKNPGQQLQDDEDEHHPAEAVVEGVGEVGNALVHRLVDRLRKRIALVEPVDDRKLYIARVWNRHQKPSTMPSTWMTFGVSPCFQVKCESGTGAGPRSTVPSRWKREP